MLRAGEAPLDARVAAVEGMLQSVRFSPAGKEQDEAASQYCLKPVNSDTSRCAMRLGPTG
eukprot:363913-Chlamydomonas_euryale.AAC.5